jgi:hypothetical protein
MLDRGQVRQRALLLSQLAYARAMLVRICVVASLVVVTPALAQKKGAKTPAVAAPAPPAAAAPTPAPASEDLKGLSNDELLKKAKALYDQLEYDQVLPYVEQLLGRGDGVPSNIRLDAFLLQGSCYAIVRDPIEAEKPFRALLRVRPDFEMPADTPPKIMGVWRKVEAEERAIREETDKALRAKIINDMAIVGEHPTAVKGGRAVSFNYLVKDPALAVKVVRVQYRKKGEPAYSSLALLRDEATGHWRAQVPGEWTANDSGATMEFFVETLDDKGPLVVAGNAAAPLIAELAAGQVDRSSPPPLPPWAVFVGAGTTGALLVAGAGFGAGMQVVQQQYDAQKNLARTEAQPGAELTQKSDLGNTLAWTANGLFIASGAAALATGVAAAFFTDWEGRSETADDDAAPAAAAGK